VLLGRFLSNETSVIEIDGEYWHGSDEQKRKDMLRDDEIKKLGYDIIRVPAKKTIECLRIIFGSDITNEKIEEEMKKIKFDCTLQSKKTKICECGVVINARSKKCRSCAAKEREGRRLKFEVSKEDLEDLIREIPLIKIGKMFGVTDNSVRKRCHKLNINIKKLSPFVKNNKD
jgi:uncharacterized protein YnzC (UPF0291/DUF896 family)